MLIFRNHFFAVDNDKPYFRFSEYQLFEEIIPAVMVYEEENYLLITRAVHVLAEEEGF